MAHGAVPLRQRVRVGPRKASLCPAHTLSPRRSATVSVTTDLRSLAVRAVPLHSSPPAPHKILPRLLTFVFQSTVLGSEVHPCPRAVTSHTPKRRHCNAANEHLIPEIVSGEPKDSTMKLVALRLEYASLLLRVRANKNSSGPSGL